MALFLNILLVCFVEGLGSCERYCGGALKQYWTANIAKEMPVKAMLADAVVALPSPKHISSYLH